MITRILKDSIVSRFFSGKVIILIGPRQVGKTTLIENIITTQQSEKDVIRFNCDYPADRELMNEQNLVKMEQLIGNKKIIFIDEGQKAIHIGNTLKILVDHYKNTKQIILSGSSGLYILHNTSEALTGRKIVYQMYPVSLEELFITQQEDAWTLQKKLEQHLLFGMYPEVLLQPSGEDKIQHLRELTASNLYKDILEFQQVKNADVITKLLKALALQIGKEISLSEIGSLVHLDLRTVERYIDLLEKCYIVFRLPPYFTNKRKELSKMNKIYFYDLGIRNAVINNFNALDSRNDQGELFENWIIGERMKWREYHQLHAYQYFWKDYNQQEIDLIEEYAGILHTFEIKWNKTKKYLPKSFATRYSTSTFHTLNQANYFSFLVPTKHSKSEHL